MGYLITALLQIFHRIYQWKNCENRSIFVKVTATDKEGRFFETQCICGSYPVLVWINWNVTESYKKSRSEFKLLKCVNFKWCQLVAGDFSIAGVLVRSDGRDADSKSTARTPEPASDGNIQTSWSPSPSGEGQRSSSPSSTPVSCWWKLDPSSRYQRGTCTKSPLDLMQSLQIRSAFAWGEYCG